MSVQTGGGTLDLNGNTITLGSSFGAGGNGTLTVSSSTFNGTLNLNNANTYTGNTVISYVNVNVNNTTGSATGSGNVTVNQGATLSGGGIITGTLTNNNNGTVSPGNGVGTLTVGALTINSGSTFNYEFSATPTNDMIVAGGLTINDAAKTAAFNLFQPGGVLPLTTTGTYNLVQFGGSIGGTGLDSSWTTPNAFNPHVGNPQVGYFYSFGTSGGYLTVTITLDATVTIGKWNVDADGNWSTAANWSSNPKVPGTPGPGDSASFGVGTAYRTVTVDQNQSVGGLRFTNNNSFLIADGGNTLILDNKGNNAPIYVSGGTSNKIQTAFALNDNAVINVAAGSSLNISGSFFNFINGPKTLTVKGAGGIALTGNSAYGPPTAGSFGTTLAGATLQMGNSGAMGAGDVAVTASSAITPGAAAITVHNNVDITPGASLTLTNGAANNLTVSGVISDGGTLVKTGTGITTLSGPNTYSGGTTINGGSFSISQDSNLGAVAPVNLNGGGILASTSTTLDPNRNLPIGAPSGTVGSTGLLDAAAGQSLTVPGTITSAGNVGLNNLTVNSLPGSTGTVFLTGTNAFTGSTFIANGILQLVSPLALQFSTLNYNGAGTLAIDPSITPAAITLGGISGSNNLSMLNLSSAPVTFTVGAGNTSSTYYGGLFDNGLVASLIKVGSGTFTIRGTNTYAGTTTVNAGTLEITTNGVLNSGGALAGLGFLVDGGTLTTPAGVNDAFNQANAFTESSGSVSVDTMSLGNNDGYSIIITGGSYSANSVTMQRGNNNAAPTATAPTAAPTNIGLIVNGATANVKLGSLIIGLTGANSSACSYMGAGILTVTNQLLIGDWGNSGRYNVFQVSGGLLDSLNPTAPVDVSQGIVIGAANSQSEFYLSGGTTMAQSVAFGLAGDSGGGVGWLILAGSPSLYVGAGGITQPAGSYTANIVLTGGLPWFADQLGKPDADAVERHELHLCDRLHKRRGQQPHQQHPVGRRAFRLRHFGQDGRGHPDADRSQYANQQRHCQRRNLDGEQFDSNGHQHLCDQRSHLGCERRALRIERQSDFV